MDFAVHPRILIVDDHEIVRQGIRTLLERERPDWDICGEATNASEALEAIKNSQPALVVLDITMPGTSGLELAQRITQLRLPIYLLMFTMHESDRLGLEVRAAGAQGYVLKSQAARDLVIAIETLLSGGTFYGMRSSREAGAANDSKAGGSLSHCSGASQKRPAAQGSRGLRRLELACVYS